MHIGSLRWLGFLLFGVLLQASAAHADEKSEARRGPDVVDPESTRDILEFTTDPSFLTRWVDYLPASDTVPSPRQYLGYSVGTPERLTSPEKINAYFRELATRSPRVQVFSMGHSHGGREMIVAAIADSELLDRLEEIKSANRRLADPRVTPEESAHEIARSTPPIYWVVAGLHSPETGPPEMVMELAFRLAVSQQPHIDEIRRRVVTLISPVLEMDGRARMVDWYRRALTEVTELEDSPPRMSPYWGDYTAHDNNRDGLQQSQALTRNYTDTYFEFLPVVSLDLHESVPLLYVSTGTGPYNDTIDPITISEWQWIASYEVSECTKLGLRGVWTWGFYTGWYPGYLLWVTNNHNAVGRFYETFGNGHPGTFVRNLRDSRYADRRLNSRQWYRAWPPEKELTWSLRNNTNYMQTAVLASLQLAARNGETLLYNFWKKGKNAIERGGSEKPHAFVIPVEQRDRAALHTLLWLLDRHRVEVHRAGESAELADLKIQPGDFIVRLDQPYRNLARTLLYKQSFPKTAELQPYDDVSWSLDYMLGLEIQPVSDPRVLELGADIVREVPPLPGRAPAGDQWLIPHRGQASLATLRWSIPQATVRALAEPWEDHPPGSLVVSGVSSDEMARVCERTHLDATSIESLPSVKTVEVDLPRIALFHTWRYTQDSGWARFTLEQLQIPFSLIDKDDLRQGELRDQFDVIVVPSTGWLDLKAIVHGIDPKWSPLPYTHTPEYPSHGVIDASPDITGGMGFLGLLEIEAFLEEGGLLVCLGGAGKLAAEGGLVRDVSTSSPAANPGSHLAARVLRPEHPVVWGRPEVTHVFRGNLPLYRVRDYHRGRVILQYGTKTRAEAEREADRKADVPVDEEPSKPDPDEKPAKKSELCRSGIVKKPDALHRAPAILDVPRGRGRVLFYSFNPLHRHQNHHDFGYLTNALLFYNDFPGTPTEEEMDRREQE